jgi:eukaryotic-like serine/threonine-protein kinase
LPPLPQIDGTPPGLEAVLLRCLAKDPARRYATVAELAGALAPFTYPAARELANRLQARQGGPASPLPGRLFVPGQGPHIATVETTIEGANGETTRSRTMSRKPKSRAALLGGFVVALVALVAVVIAVAGGAPETPTPPAGPAATDPPRPAATPAVVVVPPVVTPLAPAALPDAAVTGVGPAPAPSEPTTVKPEVVKKSDKTKKNKDRGKSDVDPYASPD